LTKSDLLMVHTFVLELHLLTSTNIFYRSEIIYIWRKSTLFSKKYLKCQSHIGRQLINSKLNVDLDLNVFSV